MTSDLDQGLDEVVSSDQGLKNTDDKGMSMMERSLPDPFSAENEVAFFSGGDRRLLLDEVAHLCQFGNNLVAVLGETGVGLTSFLLQLNYELDETASCCFIDAAEHQVAESLFFQVVTQLGLPCSPESSAGELIAILRQSMSENGQNRVVVIIDDAHFLPDQTLSALASLLQGQQETHLHLLLGGDDSLIRRLDGFGFVDLLVYDVTLKPFNAQDTHEYLDFKMRSAGYSVDEGWAEEDAYSIWEESQGYPGRINSVAQNFLFGEEAMESFETEQKAPGLPLIHMALLVVLLAALIMALFYLGDDESEAEVPVANIEIAPTKGAAPELESAAKELQPVEPPQDPSAEIVIVEKPDAALSEKITLPAEPEIKAESSFSSDIQVDEGAPSVKSVVKSTEDKNPVLEVAEAETAPPQGATKPESAAVLPEKEKAPAFTSDEAEVMSWPDSSFTLQVSAGGQEASVQRFIASQPNKLKLRMVTVERSGRPWHIVITGAYSDKITARKAIAALPQAQVNAGPWPKSVGEVKQEIADFRSK